MNLWHFSKDEDPDARPYEPADARSVQPDHYPNVVRPGGGYPEGKGHKTDAFCNSCDDQLVDGSCLRCDWGPQSRSEPIKNFPIDPVADERAGIRAGAVTNQTQEKKNNLLNEISEWIINTYNDLFNDEEFKKIYDDYINRKSKEKNKKKKERLAYAFNNAIIKLMVKKINQYINDPESNIPEDMKINISKKDFFIWKSEQKKKGNLLSFVKLKREQRKSEIIQTLKQDFYNQGWDKWIVDNWNDDKEIGNNFNRHPIIIKHELCGDDSQRSITVGSLCQYLDNKSFIPCFNKECASYRDPFEERKENFEHQRNEKKNQIIEKLKMKPYNGEWEVIDWGTLNRTFRDQTATLRHNKCGNDLKKITIATLEGRINKEKRILCNNEQCEDYSPDAENQWDSTAPAQIYIFKQGDLIKIGVTNSWYGKNGRQDQYAKSRSRSLVPEKRFKEKEYLTQPVVFDDVISMRSDFANFDQKLAKKPDRAIRGPERRRQVDRKRQDWFKKRKEDESFQPRSIKVDQVFVFDYVDGSIAEAVENAIMQFWIDLNLTPNFEQDNYTETISANTSKATIEGMDIGPDLTLEFHIFLIQKIIESGGNLENLASVMQQPINPEALSDLYQREISPEDPESQQTGSDLLMSFFDNNPNKINAAFGMKWDKKSGKYIFEKNILGSALQIDQPQIPSSMWSFDENQEQTEPQTQREQFLTEEQQRILETPQLSPYWRGLEKFQEELTKHPEWAETPLPKIPVPQDRRRLPRGEWGTFEGIRHNEPFISPIENEIRMIDTNGNQWMVYNNQWIRVGKVASYEGWSNWETWNTKLMIDNEYDLYMQSRKIVEERRSIEQFATWATQAVIAPHNQRAIADAQEWNEIPYEERPTGREDMPEGARDLIEGIEGIFGDDPREDATAEIIDESKINWNEIYNSIGEDIKESEAHAHEGGEHELPMEQYTGYTSEELIEAKADQHPWCPLCNPENPDAPGDLTIPNDWTGF